MEENESSEDSTVEDDGGHGHRMKEEVERLSETVFSKTTKDHLVRAGTEMVLAFDSMIPRDMIPDDVREHYLAAKRETILLIKSLLDAQLSVVRDIERKHKDPSDAGLKKIELE